MRPIEYPALHPLFEALGYLAAYALYEHQRSQHQPIGAHPRLDEQRWLILAAAAVGALIGSRILGLLEQAPRLHLSWQTLLAPGGKTIVGALLGGWLAVEVVKRLAHIRSRTGDAFAVPLCVGIAVGRVGCFLAGLPDDTYGIPTRLPWGINFGDGIPRHPTQLYEVLFLAALGTSLLYASKRPHLQGALFRRFLAAYLLWRFLIDFLKPQPLIHGLNMIQWASLVGLLILAASKLHEQRSIRESSLA